MSGRVGVVLVGHGNTATGLIGAARGIMPGDNLTRQVVAVDAGHGETTELGGSLCQAMDAVDEGRGVLVVVDLVGASPCNCAVREAGPRGIVTLSGLNLAMLLKLGTLDRELMSVSEVASAMADSGQRAVVVLAENDEGRDS